MPKPTNPKVLVIDNDEYFMGIYPVYLGKAGFAFVTCDNRADATEIARRESPDVILLDVLVPGLDGYGILRDLKSSGDTAGIPVILLTEDETEDEVEAAAAEGAAATLAKSPRLPADLAKKINRVLFGPKYE